MKQGETSGPDVSCRAYCIMDAETGQILCSKNANHTYAPASITKILTGLIVAEQCENLDEKVVLPEEAFTELQIVSSTLSPCSRAMEQFSVRDLLYGMVLGSGNECAAALAYYVAGSKEAFAEMMNVRAREAGAENSYFVNAHGLDEFGHKVTAVDMAKIFRAALQNPVAKEVLSAKEYTIRETNFAPERHLIMGHAMINGSWEADGVYAGKTGYTVKAGRTLVTAVKREDGNLLIVTLGSEAASMYYDTEILMEYAFAVLAGQNWASIPIVWGLEVKKFDETGCIITGKVSDDVVKVKVPVWSEANGQDDLVWKEASLNNGKVSFHLKLQEHGREYGGYTVIFYAYKADGTMFGVLTKVLVTGNPLREGLTQWNGDDYYINNNKTLAIGLSETKDGVFFADNTGKLQKGLVKSGDSCYLFSEKTGKMIDGWNFWQGNFYYVQKSGQLAIGSMKINGQSYEFDENGCLQKGKLKPWVLHQIISNF